MWYNDGIGDFADINRQINQLYCNRYGYDLIVSHTRSYTDDTTLNHERMPLLLQHIDNYERIMWIDADAYLLYDRDILELIEQYKDKDYIFSGDAAVKGQINSGVFILKSNGTTKAMLKDWVYSHDIRSRARSSRGGVGGRGDGDQRVLNLMYREKMHMLDTNGVIVDYGLFQRFNMVDPKCGKSMPFVIHFAARRSAYRTNMSSKYYKELCARM